jgi:hypothetical protein
VGAGHGGAAGHAVRAAGQSVIRLPSIRPG